jgi:hypothetical protein
MLERAIRMLKRWLILGMLFVLLPVVTASGADLIPLPHYPFAKNRGIAGSVLHEKALQLYNCAWRENSRLRWDECLAERAWRRAEDMVKRNYFSHQPPGSDTNPAWDLVASCYQYRYAGENLAKGDLSAEAIHGTLMKSPGHRKNILDQRFQLLGVGCYKNICVELFAGL